jgi:hypothetical protein
MTNLSFAGKKKTLEKPARRSPAAHRQIGHIWRSGVKRRDRPTRKSIVDRLLTMR